MFLLAMRKTSFGPRAWAEVERDSSKKAKAQRKEDIGGSSARVGGRAEGWLPFFGSVIVARLSLAGAGFAREQGWSACADSGGIPPTLTLPHQGGGKDIGFPPPWWG